MSDQTQPILQVEDLRKGFDVRRSIGDTLLRRPASRIQAVDGASFSLSPHQVVGVVGESGSGKSTLAKCLVRLLEPDSGTVRFREQDVLALRGASLKQLRRSMQMIFQDPYSTLNPMMSVGEAISEPAKVHGLIESSERGAYAERMLDLVGLSKAHANRRPRELSGGQRQRVAIARAMAVEPELLIADEAVSALDVSIQAQILNLFAQLREERGVAILFIAHQLAVVAHIADVVMVMYLGALVEAGPVDEIFSRPGHPYTMALMAAQPGKHRRRGSREPALAGEIPSPTAIPSGCRFRSRCPYAQEICAEVDPPAVELGPQHWSKCHFAGELPVRAPASDPARGLAGR
jgi:oligopeptide/dipeptide ABC transporter ATP-binding protein